MPNYSLFQYGCFLLLTTSCTKLFFLALLFEVTGYFGTLKDPPSSNLLISPSSRVKSIILLGLVGTIAGICVSPYSLSTPSYPHTKT